MFTLVDNNTYIKYNKLNTHYEESMRWLKYINPAISL